ncbi:hypothetical protein M405DRAFT_745791, partial [Rhizopogon salebrosus TDB-379]
AIERRNRMREDVYRHSRFTPRTTVTRVAIYGLVLVIGAIYHLASQTHVRCHYIHLFRVLLMVIEMVLGREAKRGGIGTVVIIPRNVQVSFRIAYIVTRRHSCELSSTHALFLFSIQRVVQNLLHNLIAILHPPPTAVLSNACAGAR